MATATKQQTAGVQPPEIDANLDITGLNDYSVNELREKVKHERARDTGQMNDYGRAEHEKKIERLEARIAAYDKAQKK